MARRAQLPEDLVRLAQIQAMPLRQESFTPDAEAIAERVRVVLSRRRSGGVPVWGAVLGLAAAFVAGVAAGPLTLNKLRLSFDPPLRVSQRLAAVEQERDEARKEGASANAKIATLQRQLAQNSTLGRLFRDCSNCPELAVVPAGREMKYVAEMMRTTLMEIKSNWQFRTRWPLAGLRLRAVNLQRS
jgi:hypothetical protein